MIAKRLTVLPAAKRDVRAAIRYYRDEAGADVAARFVAGLEHQYRVITRQSGLGSARYASELGIEGLRTSAIRRFPYLIFYLEFADRIEVARVLHAMRDIPASLQQ